MKKIHHAEIKIRLVLAILLSFAGATSCTMLVQDTFAVSGRVRICSESSSDVFVIIRHERFGEISAVTDIEGKFRFDGVLPGEYTITPEKDGYIFFPQSRTINIETENIPGQDFEVIVSWSARYGGTAPDGAFTVEQTSDCGFIVAGYTESSGAGNADFWFLKLDLYGRVEWEKNYGGAGIDIARSIRQTADGGYIAAGYTFSYGAGQSDMWVMKLDSRGNKIWDETFGGTDIDQAYSVCQTEDGGYAVAGFTDSYATTGHYRDMWILWLRADDETLPDGSNRLLRQRLYSANDWNEAYTVRETLNAQGDADGYIISGVTKDYASATSSLFTTRIDTNYDQVWSVLPSELSWSEGQAALQTFDENGVRDGYIIAGSVETFSSQSSDFWLLRLDPSGNYEIWSETFGGDRNDRAYAVDQTSDGGFIAAGFRESPVDFNNDMWIVKTDRNGQREWDRVYAWNDENEDDAAFCISQTSDGGYVVAGQSWSYDSKEDFWILKLNSNGEIQ